MQLAVGEGPETQVNKHDQSLQCVPGGLGSHGVYLGELVLTSHDASGERVIPNLQMRKQRNASLPGVAFSHCLFL